jgi:hypothetical protein
MIASEDVFRSVVIAIKLCATVGAGVPPHGEIFRHDPATSTALLAGLVRGHAHDQPTSLFRFASAEVHELAPTSVQDALV